MRVYHDPIIPGWPWVLEKDDGQLAHFNKQEHAEEYKAWLENPNAKEEVTDGSPDA